MRALVLLSLTSWVVAQEPEFLVTQAGAEAWLFSASAGVEPRPPVLLIHGEDEAPRDLLPMAQAAARSGRTTLLSAAHPEATLVELLDRARARAPCPGLRFHLVASGSVPEERWRGLLQGPQLLDVAVLPTTPAPGAADPRVLVTTGLRHATPLAGTAGEAVRTLDALHETAARADAQGYFALFAEDAVFLGTDLAERWTKAGFEAFARPHFDAGRGWVFVPHDRHVFVAEDAATAWFDEKVWSRHFGPCRGTGVLVRRNGHFLVAQYHLTIPVPNELAGLVVGVIAAHAHTKTARQGPLILHLVRHAEKETGEDPGLAEAGRIRAGELARVLGDAGIGRILASEARRTQATVAPLAARLGLEVGIRRAGDVDGLVAELRAAPAGSILICGHSNTIPLIVRGLGGPADLSIAEHAHDDHFLIVLDPTGTVAFQRLRYGAPSR
jgi:broad specificity phosphatase PhoE